MGTRILTGLILAPLVVYAVYWAPKQVFLALLVLAAAQCVNELVRMFQEIRPVDRRILMALGGLLAASFQDPVWTLTALALAPVLWLGWSIAKPESVELAARRAALGMLALYYPALLIGTAVGLFVLPDAGSVAVGRGALLGLFIMVFAGDTGAYFAGRTFGRHKLYELISPKKTMEGAVGGLAASILGGWVTQHLLLPHLSVPEGLVLGAVCGLSGQIGDLAESLFKRATGTKDSGTLLPGHGGILDRVDGVLFAAPILWAWLRLR